MHVGTFNLWSVKSKPKICKGALAELRKAGDVDHGATACWSAHRNNGEWTIWKTMERIWYESSTAQIYTSLYFDWLFRRRSAESKRKPVENGAPQRFFFFGNWCEAWPEVTCIWWAILRNMCLRSPWALPGTPTAGTPRNGTPRNGTPRNGTPRKGGGTPRNGEARGFWFAHCTVLTWNNLVLHVVVLSYYWWFLHFQTAMMSQGWSQCHSCSKGRNVGSPESRGHSWAQLSRWGWINLDVGHMAMDQYLCLYHF